VNHTGNCMTNEIEKWARRVRWPAKRRAQFQTPVVWVSRPKLIECRFVVGWCGGRPVHFESRSINHHPNPTIESPGGRPAAPTEEGESVPFVLWGQHCRACGYAMAAGFGRFQDDLFVKPVDPPSTPPYKRSQAFCPKKRARASKMRAHVRTNSTLPGFAWRCRRSGRAGWE